MQGSKEKYRGYIASIVILTIIWKLAALFIHNPALPPPELVAIAIIDNAHKLARHAAISLIRVLYAMALAFSLAFPVGIFAKEERVDRYLSPFIYVLYPIPHIVLLPLYILLFGIGDLSRVALIATILFFQIAVTTRDAARQISDYYIYSIRSLGAGKLDTYRHVVIPASLPSILTALRISIGTAIAVLFFAESFATNVGLGYLIMYAWSMANYELMYAAIATMAMLGFGLYIVLEIIEKRFCRWI